MHKILLATTITVLVTGCAAIPVVGGAVAVGVGAYCAGVSDAGKQAIRGAVTAGQKVIACDD